MTSKPWDRERDAETGHFKEPMLWFARLTLHRLCGPGRSLLGTYNKERVQNGAGKRKSLPSSWFNAARLWDWDERAEAWDLAEMERREAQYQTACDAWAKNRFEFATTARKKLDQLIAFPVVRQTKAGGDDKTYIIEPLSAKEIKDIIAAYKGIDELARTTTRERLPKIGTDITSDDRPIAVTFSGNVEPDQL